jgi:hypothetical protein
MLETLLNEIHAGGTHGTMQPAALAARMGVSPELVVMMLEDLERMGKLRRADAAGVPSVDSTLSEAVVSAGGCEETACGGCPVASMCAPKGKGKGRVWMVK